MVEIHELPERDDHAQKSTSKSSSTKRRKPIPRSHEAQKEFADKVFGGKRMNARASSSMRTEARKSTGDAPTGKETKSDAVLGTLKAIDLSLSKFLACCASPENPYRLFCVILEWSGHGVPWFAFIIYLILGLKPANRAGQYLLFNLFFGLLLDIACVGTIKSIVKRPRPKYNNTGDMHTFAKADHWSFPSGHSSRAVLMACLLIHLIPDYGAPTVFLIQAWAFWVAFSRVLLGRHYLFDVISGAILAGLLFMAMKYWLFLSQPTCRMIYGYVPEIAWLRQ